MAGSENSHFVQHLVDDALYICENKEKTIPVGERKQKEIIEA